ncbi:MAG: response regulator [Terriglobales bacterium]
MALKILLADDSMTAQNMGKKILVDAGYEVVAVSNGAAAIKKISSERPDIAILDEYMPGYTGSEVCERVKGSAETSKIPVLLTVGKMEPFDQEKANKVRADGVMIKPFEASDLIAAVQSIAQRLLAPTAPPRVVPDSTVQLRSHSGGYQDTLRVPPPISAEPSPEDTLRLTAEQMKAFQDASYKDWANTAERQDDEQEEAAVAEMSVTPAVDGLASAEPAIAEEVAEVPAMHAAAMEVDVPTSPRETPVFSAMAASGVAAEHEIFNSATTPVAPIEEATPAFTAAPVFYTPTVVEPAEEPATPAFAIQTEAPAVEAEAVSPVTVEPAVVEQRADITPPMLEPIVQPTPEEPLTTIAPALETSAPLTPGPMPVMQASDLEPTIAAAVEVAAAPTHGLEVTSPPPERGGLSVAQDPGLITESEDMAQFVTKFGVEGAEPVHVGMVSDLSEEQMAAIVTPVEPEASAVEEEPATAEAASVEEPVTHAIVEPAEEKIEAVVPVESEVAVPSLEDTQDIPPILKTEPQVPAAVVAEAPTEAVVETGQAMAEAVAEEPQTASPEVFAPVMESPVAVSEVVAEPVQVSEADTEVPSELALAAVAAAAAVSIPHVFQHESVTLQEPTVETAGSEPLVEPLSMADAAHQTFGDAALAEELAAALSKKESEERARAAADAATAAAAQPAAAATLTSVPGMMQGLSDNKLADAVARAFENLKPQLITEIIKELAK